MHARSEIKTNDKQAAAVNHVEAHFERAIIFLTKLTTKIYHDVQTPARVPNTDGSPFSSHWEETFCTGFGMFSLLSTFISSMLAWQFCNGKQELPSKRQKTAGQL